MARAGFPKASWLFEASEDREREGSLGSLGSFLWIALRTSTHLSSDQHLSLGSHHQEDSLVYDRRIGNVINQCYFSEVFFLPKTLISKTKNHYL